MKSIIILSPYYHPESSAGAKRITAIAQHLAGRNWNVTVVTHHPHYPRNAIYSGFADLPSPYVSNQDGVEVVRIRPWLVPRANLALRLLSEALFSGQATLQVFRRKADIVLASSPYMFLGLAGILAARIKNARFVWDVRDLTWLYPRAAGKRTFGMDRLLESVMQCVAHRADALSTATEGLSRYFPRKPRRCIVLPNGVSEELLRGLAALNPPASEAPPHVLYAGLFGYNHGLTTLLEAAKRLPGVRFTLAGDGPERETLESLAESYQLANVVFVGHLSDHELLHEYSEATLLVSLVRRDPIFKWTQPAKLWEYMATGRPTLHAGEGEVAKIVEEHGIGVIVPPEDPKALAEAILSILENPEEARRMGMKGRTFVETHRNRRFLMASLDKLLDEVLAQTIAGRPEVSDSLRFSRFGRHGVKHRDK